MPFKSAKIRLACVLNHKRKKHSRCLALWPDKTILAFTVWKQLRTVILRYITYFKETFVKVSIWRLIFMIDIGQSLTASRLSPVSWAGKKLFGSFLLRINLENIFFLQFSYSTIFHVKIRCILNLVSTFFIWSQKIFIGAF